MDILAIKIEDMKKDLEVLKALVEVEGIHTEDMPDQFYLDRITEGIDGLLSTFIY